MSEITKIKGVIAGKRIRDLWQNQDGFTIVAVDDDGKEFTIDFKAGLKIAEFDSANMRLTTSFGL